MSEAPRRADFDALVQGWGSDGREDLLTRLQLLSEWWSHAMPLRPAELKIAKAMKARLCTLGGITDLSFN